MRNEPDQENLSKIPRLNDTDHIPIKDKHAYLHFYLGDSHWYVIEYDGDDQFFCFVIINGDNFNSEWGYASFDELKKIKINGYIEVCNDTHWQIKKISEIKNIKVY